MSSFVVNTNYYAAATPALINDLSRRLELVGHEVTRNDWDNYGKYDFAIFMSPDQQVAKAKSQNPGIKAGIMDPKVNPDRLDSVRQADFVAVTSLEQRDALLPYNQNAFVYFSLPDRDWIERTHSDKDEIIIAYHGNKEHLSCFSPRISRAIDHLARKMDVELWAIYNIKALRKLRRGLPQKAHVKHIQWFEDIYTNILPQADIGIANNDIPVNPKLSPWLTRYFLKRPKLRGYPYRPSDVITRYKYSSNIGRIYEFSQAGLPVIADYYPSASQVIRDGESGYVVNSAHGWYWALHELSTSAELRQRFAQNLRQTLSTHYHTDKTFADFDKFLHALT